MGFQFKARERPAFKQLASTHILDVNVPYGITCEVKRGFPYPSISWTRKGMDSVIAEGPTLKFEDPLAEDQGTFFVQVSNGIGEVVRQEFTVDVRGKIPERDLKLDEEKYAICGQLKKGSTGEETIQVEYKLMEEEEDEGWKQQEFTVPAEDTSFELGLQKLRGIEEGKEYALRIRYFQSPTVFGEWLPSKSRAGMHFKAREPLKIGLSASHVVMEVGLGDEIECTIEKGYPEPTKWKWTKKGNPENVLSNGSSLKFVNPTEEDQAVYCIEVENGVTSDKQEVLVEIKDTIAGNEERFEKRFEKKMKDRLDKELGSIHTSLSESHFSIRDNNSDLNILSKSVSFLATVPHQHHTLVVSSSGLAAKKRSASTFGKYQKVDGQFHNDLPVFKKEGYSSYLYYANSNKWVVDTAVNDGALTFYATREHQPHSKAIPRFGWYVHDGTKWVVDETLNISAGDTLDGIDTSLNELSKSINSS